MSGLRRKVVYATKDPVALARQLAELEQSIEHELVRIPRALQPRFTLRDVSRSSVQARPWDAVLVDASAAALQVLLPTLGGGDAGTLVAVVVVDATNNVTVQSAGAARVNGSTSHVLQSVGRATYFWTGAEWWPTVGAGGGSDDLASVLAAGNDANGAGIENLAYIAQGGSVPSVGFVRAAHGSSIITAQFSGGGSTDLFRYGVGVNDRLEIGSAIVSTLRVRALSYSLELGSTPYITIVSGAIRANGFPIEQVADPTNAQDAATKAYVDSKAGGGAAQRLTADFSKTSDTTLANVSDLALSVGANEVWTVHYALYVAHGSGRLQVAITAPAGATVKAWAMGANAAGGVVVGVATSSGSSLGPIVPAVGTASVANVYATIVNGGTAGTVNLQAAQSTSNGTPSTIQANSHMRALPEAA